MALSKVRLCNLALAKVADDGEQIESFTGSSRAHRLLNLFYEQTLEEVLRMHNWNCATTRVQMNLVGADGETGFYRFTLPLDYVKAVRVSETEELGMVGPVVQLQWSIQGKELIANSSVVYLTYVKYIVSPGEMDSLFARCFYTALAEKLAYPMTEDRDLQASLLSELSIIIAEAKSTSSMEAYRYPVIDSDALEARFAQGLRSYQPFAQSSYGTLP